MKADDVGLHIAGRRAPAWRAIGARAGEGRPRDDECAVGDRHRGDDLGRRWHPAARCETLGLARAGATLHHVAEAVGQSVAGDRRRSRSWVVDRDRVGDGRAGDRDGITAVIRLFSRDRLSPPHPGGTRPTCAYPRPSIPALPPLPPQAPMSRRSWLVSSTPTARGRVILVGAGPGDPDLLTLRAARLLGDGGAGRARRAGRSGACSTSRRPDAELVSVAKSRARHTLPQDAINALLVREALAGRDRRAPQGRRSVRLRPRRRGGRGRAAPRACRSRSSPASPRRSARAAAAQIPLTHRDCVEHRQLRRRPVQGPDRAGLGRASPARAARWSSTWASRPRRRSPRS